LRLELVTADVAKAVFAVVTEPNLVVKDPLDGLAVTVPEMAGREEMVTLLPTVTVPPTVTALARSWVLVRPVEVALTISVIA
jgi:hypothetical protein